MDLLKGEMIKRIGDRYRGEDTKKNPAPTGESWMCDGFLYGFSFWMSYTDGWEAGVHWCNVEEEKESGLFTENMPPVMIGRWDD